MFSHYGPGIFFSSSSSSPFRNEMAKVFKTEKIKVWCPFVNDWDDELLSTFKGRPSVCVRE